MRVFGLSESVRRYVLASAMRELGGWFFFTLLIFGTVAQTKSAVSAAVVAMAGSLPLVLMAIRSPHMIKRQNRKIGLVTGNAFHALSSGILAALAYYGVLEYWIIPVVNFANGLVSALIEPASKAYMRDISQGDEVVRTPVENALWRGTAQIIAHLLLLVLLLADSFHQDIGAQVLYFCAYAVGAASDLIAVMLLLGTKPVHSNASMDDTSIPTPRPSGFRIRAFLAELRDAWDVVRSNRILNTLIILNFGQMVFGTTYHVFPGYLANVLDRGIWDFVLVRFIGVTATTLCVFVACRRGSYEKPWLKSGQALAALFAVEGLVQIVYPLSADVLVLYFTYPIAFCAQGVAEVAIILGVQEQEGTENHGHKFAALDAITALSSAVVILTGLLPEVVGNRWTIPLIGLTGIAFYTAVFLTAEKKA